MLYVLPAGGGARSPGGRSSWGPGMGAQPPASPPSWPAARRPRAKIHHPFKQQEKPNESGITAVTDEDDFGRSGKSLSECYFASKGAAVVLSSGGSPGDGTPSRGGARRPPPASASSTDIQQHLQSMFYLLRPEETLKMAVKLESVHPGRTRYLVVVSRGGNSSGSQGAHAEEACLLGIDCNRRTTVGLVLRVLADTGITLDGDGGFSVSVCGRQHIFKPVSVQAMWSALQTLHRVSSGAREQNYFMGGTSHSWVTYYEQRIDSDRSCLNEWHAMDCIESRRPPSPDSVRTKPREREETEQVIRSTLKEIMMSVDLDEVTSKVIRGRLEEDLDMDLGEFKPFIDQEMITILGQMDAPTEIFDHVYLGSEWNASNLEELQKNGVRHILNVTREIDNFFPGMFNYLNIRVYDDEKTDLLKHWDKTFKYITRARKEGSKVLVHCKMGVSRSASVVIAYAMKAFDWDFNKAMKHVKEKRNCIKPNTSFLSQLETYQGILDAMKNKEKLQRSKSETNLKSPGLVSKTDSRIMEPTPLIQALTGRCRERPRSWSPDTRLASQLLPPTSLSLENLAQETKNVLMPCANGSYSVSQNRIMRLREDGVPSVKHIVNELESQAAATIEKKTQRERRNLKLNLANHIDSLKYNSVLDVGDRTDLCDDNNSQYIDRASGDMDDTSNIVQSKETVGKTETWDPGESNEINHKQTTDNLTNCDLNEIVKCDSGIVDVRTKPNNKLGADLFSKHTDNVFDKEERRVGEAPSRQGSWSSCDSAVGLERNSSWGSYDTKPSRNSSWGSYDEQWNTGTVKRTKLKLEESTAKKICSDGDSIHSDVVNEAINTVLTHKLCGPHACDLDIINENHEQQRGGVVVNCNNVAISLKDNTNGSSSDSCSSDMGSVYAKGSAILRELDFAGDELSSVNKVSGINFTHLSASAPSASSNFFDKIPTSPSASSVGNIFNSKNIDLPKTSIVKALINSKHKTAVNDFKVDKSNNNNNRTISGKVKNLKMEFEAKSNLNNDTISGNSINSVSRNFLNVEVSVQNVNNSTENNNKSKGRSLPSSPVSVHNEIHSKPVVVDDDTETSSAQVGHTTSLEDLSVKVLVGKYDRPKSQQITSKTNFAEPPVPMRQSSLNLDTKKKPNPAARNSICGGIQRNPPVTLRPPVVPTVVAMSPINFPSAKVVVASVVAKAQTKKQQQHGKTHPLARLKNHTTNRCTNPVYNTM